MPLLENNVIFAYLNEYNPNHEIAEGIFEKLRRGELRVEISSISQLEWNPSAGARRGRVGS
ncbi:MAG: hypothetical protein QXI55_01360 [Thermofilum sp.]